VRRAQQGDRAAFRALFDKYHRRCFAVALGVVKDPSDAHDVVQEAFVKVHRHLATFQGASSFYTWLYRITMNLSIDGLRRKKSARQVAFDEALQPDGEAEGAEVLSQKQADPAKLHARKELAREIEQALSQLPEIHRQAILLRELEGLSYEEIAQIMQVPKGTIMSRLFHARRKLQAALAGYVEARGDARERDLDGGRAPSARLGEPSAEDDDGRAAAREPNRDQGDADEAR
jgi:RNA polymerase sigma-70 factor (ECF subfamily)